jgi:hypothetical protein
VHWLFSIEGAGILISDGGESCLFLAGFGVFCFSESDDEILDDFES